MPVRTLPPPGRPASIPGSPGNPLDHRTTRRAQRLKRIATKQVGVTTQDGCTPQRYRQSMLHRSNVEWSLWIRRGSRAEAARQSRDPARRRAGAGTWPGAVFGPVQEPPAGREDLPGQLQKAADRTCLAVLYVVVRVMGQRSSASSAQGSTCSPAACTTWSAVTSPGTPRAAMRPSRTPQRRPPPPPKAAPVCRRATAGRCGRAWHIPCAQER